MRSTARPTNWLRLVLALAVGALALCVGLGSVGRPTVPQDDARALNASAAAVVEGRLSTPPGSPSLAPTPRSSRNRDVGRRAPRPTTSQLTGVIRELNASLPLALAGHDVAPALDRVRRGGREGWHSSAPTRAPPHRRVPHRR